MTDCPFLVLGEKLKILGPGVKRDILMTKHAAMTLDVTPRAASGRLPLVLPKSRAR